MAGERNFTRIPPESTGDRVYMVHTLYLPYDGADANYTWVIGDRYYINGGSGDSITIHVHGVFKDAGATSGVLSVHVVGQDRFNNLVPINDQDIRSDGFSGTIRAQVNGTINVTNAFHDVYVPTTNIMGYDNPEYGLDVDVLGSANVRFAEGQPQLDAWGKLRTAGATMLGNYVFGGEAKVTDNFSPVEIDTGYVNYDQMRKSVKVGFEATGVTAATFAANTSNTYHPYIPGSSHLWQGTFLLNSPATGDGTNGAIRRWGLFDADNGFFFRLGKDGHTAGTASTTDEGFAVVIRSKTSGSVVNTIIKQDDFNGDKLDGSGKSQLTFDLEKNNQYWIDIQWHGAGRVRFGTYLNGTRIVMHTYYAGNVETAAMSQTASLPSCTSIKSAGTPLTSLYVETWAQSVWSETELDATEFGKPSTYASTHATVDANIDSDWQYLFSMSPKEVLTDGRVDHALFMPTSISAYGFDQTSGATNGLDAVVDLKAEVNSVLNHGNWTDIAGTNVQYSYPTAGDSAYEGGGIRLQEMFAGRYETLLTDTYNNFQYGALKNFAEDGGTVENTITGATQTNPVVITTGEPLKFTNPSPHAVNFPLNINRYQGKMEINDVLGMTELNGNKYLVKPTSTTSFELYTDSDGSGAIDPATSVDGSAFTAYTSGGAVKGFRGSRLTWSFYVKTRTMLHDNVKLMLTINWKEIIQ